MGLEQRVKSPKYDLAVFRGRHAVPHRTVHRPPKEAGLNEPHWDVGVETIR